MKKASSTRLKFSALAAGVAIACSALAAAPAQAFSLFIDPQYGSSNNPPTGATAKLDFNFSQQGADVLLSLGISNTTGSVTSTVTTRNATQATLVGVGFDLASIISSYTYNSSGSTFTKLYGDSSYNRTVQGDASLSPFGTFDVGIRSAGSGNFTGGNPQQGLTAGNSTAVTFTLQGSSLTASDVEDKFKKGFSDGTLRAVGRFQQVSGVNFTGASDKVLGGGVVYEDGPTKIPEPSAVTALLLTALALRSAKRQKEAATV